MGYLFVADSVAIPLFSFTQRAPDKAICSNVIHYGRLRSFNVIEIGINQKLVCDFRLAFNCIYNCKGKGKGSGFI